MYFIFNKRSLSRGNERSFPISLSRKHFFKWEKDFCKITQSNPTSRCLLLQDYAVQPHLALPVKNYSQPLKIRGEGPTATCEEPDARDQVLELVFCVPDRQKRDDVCACSRCLVDHALRSCSGCKTISAGNADVLCWFEVSCAPWPQQCSLP